MKQDAPNVGRFTVACPYFSFNVQYYFVVVSFIWHDPRMLIAHSGVRAVAGHALHQRTSALVLV